MLVLTEQAQSVIRDAIADGGAGPNGGLRITTASDDGETELDFELVADPVDGDDVVEAGGARVFLDGAASGVLTDKVLDVHGHGDHFHFEIGAQES